MRKGVFSVIYVLIISGIVMLIFPIFISTTFNSDEYHSEISTLNTSASTEINTPIIINDLPNSLTNWTWAKDQGYCTGSGNQSNPYIISNLFFNTSMLSENSLTISHSRKHFVVRDCEFKASSQFAGIKLDNTTNGVITENFMHPLTGALVWANNASYNVIQNNNASGGFFYGVLIDSSVGASKMNIVSDNIITHNANAGIQFRGMGSDLNNVSNNIIFNNSIGIELGIFASNNTIKGNQIGNSSYIGVFIEPLGQYNEIFENCFFTNNIHAYDNAQNNSWDNGVKGNYWDNYTGLDPNNDGIGDIPYNITGIGGSQDNFPLMSCPVPSSSPPGIPGYDIFLVLFAGGTLIIITIFITLKRKSKTKIE